LNKKLLALYGLKFNPFAPDVPVEALQMTPRIESFCWRVEQLAGEGGFAVVHGSPGVGKSVTLRILAERLAGLRDVQVGVLSRPQAGMADFYREMGELFGVELHPHNRHGGAKVLRARWQGHIDNSLCRPVLIADEAQEMQLAVLNELRLLSSARLDSHLLLTVVLAGDQRLIERFRAEDLLPLGSPHAGALGARAQHPGGAAGVSAPYAAKSRRRETHDPGSHRHGVRSRAGKSARADEHGRRTAGSRSAAGSCANRREAVLRPLLYALADAT
jgi:hypothetical protein